MAKNFVQPGDVLEITSAGAVVSGAAVLVGSLLGVALNSVAGAGEKVSLAVQGVFDLPKVGSQAWTVGALIYWTGTACTTTASTNKLIGVAAAAVGSGAGETTGRVRLNGAGITA
jgi:predicted RecA/RadA family phage recombinase